MQDILNYFGSTNTAYLHARGKVATQKLIEWLDLQSGEKIVEIGFGTGATLVQLASRYKDVALFGYELSELMFRKASKRISFCGLNKRITLQLLQTMNRFPAKDCSFDKIYVESVIGIQEDDHFVNLFKELYRVLKPGGTLVFNETIWLDTTPEAVIHDVNTACKSTFGIIQANADFPYLNNWTTLLTDLGFEVEEVLSVSEIQGVNRMKSSSLSALLSSIYSKYGKLKSKISRSLKSEWDTYTQAIDSFMPDNKIMEGMLVKVRKKG